MQGATAVLSELHESVELGRLNDSLLSALLLDPKAIRECEVLDFKEKLPSSDSEYAKTLRDVVALHNSFGGFIVFGVKEVVKDREVAVVGVEVGKLGVAKIRDMARAYCGVDIRFAPMSATVGDLHVEVIWVAKRAVAEQPVRLIKNGPEEKPGKVSFKKGDVVFRRIDNNALAQLADDYEFLYSERKPPSLSLGLGTLSTDPLDNNLPDRVVVCAKFVGRASDLGDLWKWLADDFSRVRLIAGEGGLGKTSVAYKFSEEVARRRIKPFEKVVWLTAKKKQFIASRDDYRVANHVDYSDASSLFRAIGVAHGCIDSDFGDSSSDVRQLMQVALQSCAVTSSFVVVDDVDSLSPEDQLRALEFGMRLPPGTKMLLTTRVNFSYSPDNVLKLDGLQEQEFLEYVNLLRERYKLSELPEGKVAKLRGVTGGSPMFSDSLMRLERRGLTLDKAMSEWHGERGLEARKAALQREVQQLSKEAKKILYVVSKLKNCSYLELSRIVDYTDQTMGDALQELSGLFLISAPAIAKEARYTIEANTALLVQELAQSLGIPVKVLDKSIRSLKEDAVGISITKRSSIVGLAISEAIASLNGKGAKDALEVIQAASKKLSKPHPDLLLATGRFSLKLSPPSYEEASRAFDQAYELGQRKSLLYDLWFGSELARGAYDSALDIATKAIEDVGDQAKWYEARAQVNIKRAERLTASVAKDAAVRAVHQAHDDLLVARKMTEGVLHARRLEALIAQVRAVEIGVRAYPRPRNQ